MALPLFMADGGLAASPATTTRMSCDPTISSKPKGHERNPAAKPLGDWNNILGFV